MIARQAQTDLLLQAGRLLLEYNESTEAIHCALKATASALTDNGCEVVVTYRGVVVSLAGESTAMEPVKENTLAARYLGRQVRLRRSSQETGRAVCRKLQTIRERRQPRGASRGAQCMSAGLAATAEV